MGPVQVLLGVTSVTTTYWYYFPRAMSLFLLKNTICILQLIVSYLDGLTGETALQQILPVRLLNKEPEQ